MKKLTWFYDQDEQYSPEEELKYRDRHRKTARIQKCLEIANGWKDCESILDVGCKTLGFIDMVGEQYKRKNQIDHYQSRVPLDGFKCVSSKSFCFTFEDCQFNNKQLRYSKRRQR